MFSAASTVMAYGTSLKGVALAYRATHSWETCASAVEIASPRSRRATDGVFMTVPRGIRSASQGTFQDDRRSISYQDTSVGRNSSQGYGQVSVVRGLSKLVDLKLVSRLE